MLDRLFAALSGQKKKSGQPDSSFHIDPSRRYNQFSDILPWTGYWKEEKLFAIEGEKAGSITAIGYTIELFPQTGATEDMSRLIQELFSGLPVGSGVQIQLYGCPSIHHYLQAYCQVVKARTLSVTQQQLMSRMTESRIKHYRRMINHSVIPSRPNVMRNYRVILSVSIPVKGQPEHMVDRILEMRDAQVSRLKTYHQFSHIWDAEQLIGYVRSVLSPVNMQLGEIDPVDYDDSRPLRNQILYRDTKYSVGSNGVTVANARGDATCIRAHSVLSYPKQFHLYQVANMLGDVLQGAKGYPCPFIITMGAQLMDLEQHKGLTQMKAARAVQVAESPLAKAMPEMVKRAEDWRIMQNAYDEGGGGIRLFHQILLFPDPERIAQADEAMRSIWRSMSFTVSNDIYMQVQAIMSCLPMGLSPGMLSDLSNAQRMTTRTLENAGNLAPVLGEWRGIGEPVIAMLGRGGQVMGVDLFSNPSGNYNGCVVGTSGSGKSAFMNELATRYLAKGAKVWIIDVGRSYEKLCGVLDGQYLEFTQEANVVLNPFTMVTDIREDMEMLKPLLAQMISPSRPLFDYEQTQLERFIQEIWDQHGCNMTMDMLAEALKHYIDPNDPTDTRVRDLGVQLHPYTSQGSYGRYFAGQHNVNFNSNLVVLELEELKSKKDLQSVVLFILMYRITQEMYLAPREQPKVVIMDEAWDLLTGGQTGDFIEAGYRRARKYGGAFLTGTQGIKDYERSPAALASRENADWMFLLRQKAESVSLLEPKLSFTPHMVSLASSLRTEQGLYSEIFVSCGEAGYGVGILSMDRYSQLMGSANARDYSDIQAKRQMGMNMAEAIESVLTDRGVHEY